MKKIATCFLASLFYLGLYSANAQKIDTLEIQRNEFGTVSFARFQVGPNTAIQNAVSILNSILQTKAEDEFRLVKEAKDKLGFQHQVYQQYYKGIKVDNAEYLVHARNGNVETINGDFGKVNIDATVAAVTEQQALDKALGYVKAEQYKWQDSNMERLAKQNSNNPSATYFPKGDIVITKDFLNGGKNFKLAWRFTISSLRPSNEQLIYIDAITGEVIRQVPLIPDVNVPCTAGTRYSGTLTITGDSFAGGFRLRENRAGVDVSTLNINNSNNYAGAVDFTNTSTNFTNGNWATFNVDRPALDAHWGAETILDYWLNVHGRNSLDGNGIRILGYVHYAPGGTPFNNAQWVPGANNHFMQYGDGDGFLFNPLTSLDICAHEMGHGITEFTANLTPGTQESAALNEGFSDIWGACVEHWSAPAKQTWLIGEEILTAGFAGIRNLQNPKSTTTAEGQHPDTYHGNFWDAGGESHTNSTVLSHWFFLTVQGGSGTNDNSVAFSVNGVGFNDAERIAFRAESMYLNSSATYSDARNATITSARDLFGVGSCQEITVTNSWNAVGVGAAYSGNAGLVITGDNIVCSSTSNTYAITNLPGGATVAWQASPSGVVTFNSPNSTQTTLNKNNNGVVTISAVVSICGTQIVIPKPNVIIGAPLVYSGFYTYTNYPYGSPMGLIEDDENEVCYSINPTTMNTIMDIRGASSVSWQKTYSTPPTLNWGQNGNNLAVSFKGGNQLGNFTLSATNTCGTTSKVYLFRSVSCGMNYIVSPNPASNMINVAFDEKQTPPSSQDRLGRFDEVRIYDMQGNAKKLQKFSKTTTAAINISELAPGTYYVEIISNNYKETQKLIVNK